MKDSFQIHKPDHFVMSGISATGLEDRLSICNGKSILAKSVCLAAYKDYRKNLYPAVVVNEHKGKRRTCALNMFPDRSVKKDIGRLMANALIFCTF
jgi:hypothetical protein